MACKGRRESFGIDSQVALALAIVLGITPLLAKRTVPSESLSSSYVRPWCAYKDLHRPSLVRLSRCYSIESIVHLRLQSCYLTPMVQRSKY